MKRIFSGLLAIVVVAGAVAFKKEPRIKQPSTTTFYYQAPAASSYSKPNVEDKANWVSNLDGAPDCEGDVRACQIDVDDSYTHSSDGARVFNTSGMVANIAAVAGTGGTSAYVPTTGGSSVGIIAKADRL